ncbi:sodium transporter [Tamlana nanhaiensis]|uniref:Sodium transporter n=1 Tax=Neotamlana nanhaiensis TaxID=1382798 RepID=A0A0D7W975_9FLAO|nr:sodium:solute symporter [Tamlana nanhaiensis]KJD34327.1 sodium transporter [Tamlana nanhaiensis]
MLNLHWIDIVIVILTVIITLGAGFYFARKNKSTKQYFFGSNNIPAWAIGMSIFATLISSVTFLAYPSAAYKSNWILLVQGLMVPIVLVCFIWVLVPLFRKVIKLSTYEYFERRFSPFARMYSSLAFVLTHFSKMGTVLYLVSLALATLTGIDVTIYIVFLTIIILFLTLLGGIEAVIWMDVIQGFLLIGGGLLCVFILLFKTDAGAGFMLSEAVNLKKIDFGPYDFSFSELTFWVMVINGAFYALQKYGTDQTIVQRYLTAKTDKDAKKAAYFGVFASVPVWTLFMLIGALLYVFYNSGGAQLPENLTADQVFTYFIGTELPVGAVGLVLAALIAAAVSSLDSDMNCLAAVGVQDFYSRFYPNSSDKQRLRVGRLLVLFSGVAMAIVALLYAAWDGQGVLGVVFKLYAIFSAGIVGIFMLGLFSKKANKQGLHVGIIVCILFTAYAILTTTKIGDKLILDLGSLNFPHHKYMLGVYSHLIVLVIGYLASLCFKSDPVKDELTIYGYFKMKNK